MEKQKFAAKLTTCFAKAGLAPITIAIDEDEDGVVFFDLDGYLGIRTPFAPYVRPFPYTNEDVVAVKFRSARPEDQRQNNEFDMGYVVLRFASGEDFFFLPDGDYCADILVEGKLRYFGESDAVFARYAEMREAIRLGLADYEIEQGDLISYNGDAAECIVPDGVRRIAPFAFSWANVRKVTLPKGLVEIGQNAFEFCSKLSEVVWNEELQYIGYQAFRGCTALTQVTLPKSVELIDDEAFVESGLQAFLCYSNTQIAPTAFDDTPYRNTL